MKLKLKSSFWIVFMPLILLGQTEHISKNKDVSWTYPENCYFHLYDPPLKAGKDYNSKREAINDYPEKFMISLASENTTDWFIHNREDRPSKARIEKMIKDRKTSSPNNYYELTSKTSFQVNGTEFAIIQFFLHLPDKDKKMPGAISLVKIGDKWKLRGESGRSIGGGLYNWMFIQLKAEIVEKIFKQEFDGHPYLKELSNGLVEDGHVNLMQLLKKWEKISFKTDPDRAHFFMNELKF